MIPKKPAPDLFRVDTGFRKRSCSTNKVERDDDSKKSHLALRPIASDKSKMTSPRRMPIFDGHNDVLLRLYRRGGTDAPRAFLEGEGKGQLDLPMARQGGFAGGLFA